MSSKEAKPNPIQIGPDGEIVTIFDPKPEIQEVFRDNIKIAEVIRREDVEHESKMRQDLATLIPFIEQRKQDLGNFCLSLQNNDHIALIFMYNINEKLKSNPKYLMIRDGQYVLLDFEDTYIDYVKVFMQMQNDIRHSEPRLGRAKKIDFKKEKILSNRDTNYIRIDRSGNLELSCRSEFGVVNIFSRVKHIPISYELGNNYLETILHAEEDYIMTRSEDLKIELSEKQLQINKERSTMTTLIADFASTSSLIEDGVMTYESKIKPKNDKKRKWGFRS